MDFLISFWPDSSGRAGAQFAIRGILTVLRFSLLEEDGFGGTSFLHIPSTSKPLVKRASQNSLHACQNIQAMQVRKPGIFDL